MNAFVIDVCMSPNCDRWHSSQDCGTHELADMHGLQIPLAAYAAKIAGWSLAWPPAWNWVTSVELGDQGVQHLAGEHQHSRHPQ
jgi:hypothetical protein